MKILTDDIYIELKGEISDKMSEKAFYNFCVRNDLARLERDGHGNITIRPLVGFIYSNMNGKVCGELGLWNKTYRKGVGFGSMVGFTLKDNGYRRLDNNINCLILSVLAHLLPSFL